MAEDITIRYKLKLCAEKYNKRQKSLYINSFIFRIVLILLLVVVLFFLSFFLLPLATPLLLKSNVMVDTLIIMIITLIGGAIITVVMFSFLKGIFGNNTKKRNLTKTANSISQQNYKSGSFITRFFRIFSLCNDILTFFISVFFAPINKPDSVNLNNNKLSVACWLIKKLSAEPDNFVVLETIKEEFKDSSAVWINKTIEELAKIRVITLLDVENKGKIVFFHPDY